MGISLPSTGNGYDPNADKSALIIQSSSATIALSCTAVLLRFVSRRVNCMSLRWDDWLILIALVCPRMISQAECIGFDHLDGHPFAVTTAALPIEGTIKDDMGRHTFGHSTLDSLHRFLKALYAYEITYTVAVAVPRFSMIALYLRVFPTPLSSKSFRWPILAISVLNAMWMTAMESRQPNCCQGSPATPAD